MAPGTSERSEMGAKILRVVLAAAMVTLCIFVVSGNAAAQCAMCRASVPQAFAKNLNVAVIVLLAPPVSIFAAIFLIAFRNRKG